MEGKLSLVNYSTIEIRSTIISVAVYHPHLQMIMSGSLEKLHI